MSFFGNYSAAFSWHLTEERIDQFYYDCWMGVRRYLLNDPDESLPQANRKMRRLKLADRVVKAIFYALLAYWLWKSALLQSFETQLVRLGNR